MIIQQDCVVLISVALWSLLAVTTTVHSLSDQSFISHMYMHIPFIVSGVMCVILGLFIYLVTHTRILRHLISIHMYDC